MPAREFSRWWDEQKGPLDPIKYHCMHQRLPASSRLESAVLPSLFCLGHGQDSPIADVALMQAEAIIVADWNKKSAQDGGLRMAVMSQGS